MSMHVLVEMNEFVWNRLMDELKDLTPEEVEWRPLPQANNINLIVRRLRIEAEWQLASLRDGEPMPIENTEALQRFVDSIGFDFQQNCRELEKFGRLFIDVLREMDDRTLQERNQLVYGDLVTKHSLSPNFLSFHHPVHVSGHWGQIRTIRTLYRKTRGEPVPARFYPDNPTFPHSKANTA